MSEEKEKQSTSSGGKQKRTFLRSDSGEKYNTKKKYNRGSITNDQESTVKSSQSDDVTPEYE